MKKLGLLLAFQVMRLGVSAQDMGLTKTKFVIGVSAPELLHAGVGFDLTTINQLGFTVGVGPTLGGVWPTVSAEHRLYFGKVQASTNRRKLFFRQGAIYYTAGDEGAGVLSLGIDLKSKKANRGWTIDAGYFLLFPRTRDRYRDSFPALRFQYFSYFKKA
ncbi:hypothetical protein SAMN00120144_0993 [Hymenobacter roseosalivarius DSM 11622]|uniref:Outer membrane protein beta-barrel domain-containing protein n=1 Tax=Hymenobacter roseosalivarius DSM 11622 TaxID=645990 RepID=A0A1W1V8X0_9BACT|nr:hypothetical protein [Hymenobacter roseosalivarius]SMB89889.1 hypothetical protein SAMN00120144_0993 [Hymenobacter roseosalivarius DSM 11622]